MKQSMLGFLCGIIFSIGLAISGMINPTKVLNFLNVLGDWDMDLLFVFIGALWINFMSFHWILKKKSKKIQLPQHKRVDRKLVGGSLLFGIGWGVSGICPGPAIANLHLLDAKLLTFVVTMLMGMLLFRLIEFKLKMSKQP